MQMWVLLIDKGDLSSDNRTLLLDNQIRMAKSHFLSKKHNSISTEIKANSNCWISSSNSLPAFGGGDWQHAQTINKRVETRSSKWFLNQYKRNLSGIVMVRTTILNEPLPSLSRVSFWGRKCNCPNNPQLIMDLMDQF